MILNETNYIKEINAFGIRQWQPLLDLIPEIELENTCGVAGGGEEIEKGVYSFPHISESSLVNKFREVVYSIPVIISFDWVSWDEGRKIFNDESFDYCSIDIPAKCKIITAIVRNDRFCEGELVAAFESGLILNILKAIRIQLGISK